MMIDTITNAANAAVSLLLFAFKWLIETEEEDLIITRKNSAKADSYERNASTIKV